MNQKADITADTLELLLLNQTSIRASLEEVSLWISQRGSVEVHDNVLAALTTMDRNNEFILAGIAALKGEQSGPLSSQEEI